MKTSNSNQLSKPDPTLANGELRRNAEEHAALAILEGRWQILGDGQRPTARCKNYQYIDERVRLQFELLKMQE